MLKLLCASLLLLAAPHSTHAQQLTKADSTSVVAFASSRIEDFRSTINGHPYRLWVILPLNYDSHPESRYPVLYLLDGGITLAPAAGVYRLANRTSDSLIMVGVGFSDGQGPRYRGIDYSLPLSSAPDSATEHAANAGRCCQAARTVQVFRDELIPLIDRRYRTTSDRGILGISWSAIFAAYALVTNPELFDRYAITSPSPWTDNQALFELEAKYAESHSSLQKRVFISVGAYEGTFNRYSAARLSATLEARRYKGLELTSVILPDAYHNSVQQYAPALRALYPPRQFAERLDTTSILKDLRGVTEDFLTALGQRDLQRMRGMLVGGPEFQAVVRGKLLTASAYLEAIRAMPVREFAGFRVDTLHGSWDRPYNGVDAPRTAVFIASYTLRPAGHAEHKTLAIELRQKAQGWRISYVQHGVVDTVSRTTAVLVRADGHPIANAEVTAEWTAGPFASARTNDAGWATLPFDWRFDWLRTGHVAIRALGFQTTFVPAPTRDSLVVELKRVAPANRK